MGNPSSRPFPTKKDAPIERLITPFQKFFRYEASSGIILLITVILALFWANIATDSYFSTWTMYFTISLGSFELSKPVYLWINDLLMAVFFLLVGLEVKREILIGELRNPKNAMLPIAAAIGGIIIPALFYLVFNSGDPLAMRGWAIPAATDIAFALGILYLLGNKVPFAARVFLATLAIIDDIAAILIIALFYTSGVNISFLILAGIMFILLIGLNLLNVRSILPYMLVGTVMWYGFFGSGIHATIAGVFLAITIPASIKMDFMDFRKESGRLTAELSQITSDENISSEELPIYQNTISALERAIHKVESPLQRLEHALVPWVSFVIMPIFALANAGVVLSPELISQTFGPISLGIIFGLVIGKPVGIFLLSYLAVKIELAKLPEDLTWNTILGLGFLAGIGFTMSTFISSLAFEFYPNILETTKVAILIASFISGIIGYTLLNNEAKDKIVVTVGNENKLVSEIPS